MVKSPAINPLALIKLVLLVIATAFGAYKGGSELMLAINEPAPTSFEAADFATNYEGQRWLEVRGHVALEHTSVRLSEHKAHAGKAWSYVHAPVVGEAWDEASPVHIVVTFGPFDRAELDSWKRETHGLIVVSGEVRPVPLPEAEDTLHITLGDPFVVINEGTRPDMSSSLFFLAMMVVFGGLAIHVLVGIWRERRGLSRTPK